MSSYYVQCECGRKIDATVDDVLSARIRELEAAQDSEARVIRQQLARIRELEGLLLELTDIEGPQPGHVMWYRKVQAALGRDAKP